MKRRDFLRAFALAGAVASVAGAVPAPYLRGVSQLVAGGFVRGRLKSPVALFIEGLGAFEEPQQRAIVSSCRALMHGRSVGVIRVPLSLKLQLAEIA